MTIFEKIKSIYPTLTDDDFMLANAAIQLQNDGEGDYIAVWNHPTLAKPTEDQLK